MKRLLTAALLAFSSIAFGATMVPSTLINWVSAPSAPSQTAKFVFAAPNGSAGVPTFRQLIASDIPTLAPLAGASPTGTWAFAVRPTFNGATPYDTANLATSANLAAALSDETGTGVVVFGTSPAITSPAISGGTINNASVGATTPNTGAFTTLAASGLITPASAVGIKGTVTNDSAQAGSVGEVISSNVGSGSAISLTSNAVANITSISLTAGDWDVWGNCATSPAGSTVQATTQCAISTTSGTFPAAPTGGGYTFLPFTAATGAAVVVPAGYMRQTLASTTTVFLVVASGFSVSTNAAYGFIAARRRRR